VAVVSRRIGGLHRNRGLSGLIVVKLKLPSFIVTLAMSFIVEGILLYILDHVFEGVEHQCRAVF